MPMVDMIAEMVPHPGQRDSDPLSTAQVFGSSMDSFLEPSTPLRASAPARSPDDPVMLHAGAVISKMSLKCMAAAFGCPESPPQQLQCWLASQVSEMLGNVLKMASENKITAKNTWSLQLIDHLSDLVKSGEERTNFQRASCTLDAVGARASSAAHQLVVAL